MVHVEKENINFNISQCVYSHNLEHIGQDNNLLFTVFQYLISLYTVNHLE